MRENKLHLANPRYFPEQSRQRKKLSNPEHLFKLNSHPSYTILATGTLSLHLSWLFPKPSPKHFRSHLHPTMVNLSVFSPVVLCRPESPNVSVESYVFSGIFMSSDSTSSWLMGFLRLWNNAITLSISLHGDKRQQQAFALSVLPLSHTSLGIRRADMPHKHVVLLSSANPLEFRVLAWTQ